MKSIPFKLTTITIFLFISLVSYSQPSSWVVFLSGSNHTVLIPSTISLTLNGQNNAFPDFWLGAFYTDNNGDFTCAGYQYWDGNATAIAVWGKNGYLHPGFKTGEEFIFKIFAFDGQDSIIYDAISFFIQITGTYQLSHFNTYSLNGISGLQSLIATTQKHPESQVIDLPYNWSIFSTYLIPLENDISNLLNPVINNLILAKDGNGQVYWPFFGLNMIGDIEPGKGYQVKMAAADTLHVEGSLINPDVFELELQAGWDIMAYILTQAKPIEDVLLPIINNVVIVKDYNGNVYWPGFGLNMIGNMYPGQGYQIKTTVADTLIFGESRDIAAICPPTVSDFDGNLYNTILIGHQCWMAENLKTSHYSTGDSITYINSNYNWETLSTIDKAYCHYNNSSSYGNTYGALYTWAAAMNGAPASGSGLNRVQGVCPAGWYLPAERDWEELADYINLQNGYYERDMWFWKGVGGHLKSTTNWYYYGIGTDDYGFSGQAAGKRDYKGQFSLLTESGYWWTASQTNSDLARVRKLFYRNDNFFNFDHKKENGFSVRCLLDTCTVYPSPSAIAGNDTLNLLDTFVVLQGNVPIIGSGHWSIVNGTGGIISDENNPNSVFSGLEIHEYTLVWSISNVCGYTCDTLHINFLCQTIPTQANAGPDQLNLIDTFTTLQANTPIAGTGHWSISTGTGGIISDINNPSTQFNGLLLHDYYLVWTVGNVCYNTYDTVHISFSCGLPPDQANAGPNQINLPDTFTVLQADTPSIGNGHWELIDGVGCEIANSTNPSSAFSGIQGHEYLLTWTVDNNNQCEPSIDTVHISFLCLSPPTQAFAGIDQINIPDTFTSLQANVAVSGVGQWNIQTGTGGQIYNLTNPTSQFHGLAANEYELIWTIGNICYSTSDTVTISFSCGLPPTQANAGPNQENIVDTFTILQANTPINGTGSWSILNDTGGMFSNIHDPSTVFYGQPLNEYDIIWTITNLCGETSDTVSIGFSCGLPPTQANAGPDQLNLVDAFTTLQANTPISGTGHWSIVSGVGGQLADIHAPNSQFNALPLNEYTLVWTIGNACNYTHDTVIISFSCGLPPTQANAGPDQLNIVSSLIELQGNYPFSGNGTWAIIDGTGGLLIYLGFDTYFSGSPDTTYYLTWTISNLCGESVDTIIVSQSCGPPPTQANAGPDQLNLVDTFTTLSANTPVSGNGQWSILSGTGGVIANTYQPCSQFSGIAGNQYSLVWTTYIFMTPICEQSRDTVVISFAPDTSSYSYGFSTSNSAINVTGAVQGICPTGWHLPNDTAWNELTSYIENDNGGTSNGYIFSINNYGVSTWTKVGGHLKTTLGWNNNGNSTNDYGFSAIHAGTRALNGFGYLGIRGFWWSSSFQYYAGMERFLLGYSNNFFNTYGINVEGTSVRCVKD